MLINPPKLRRGMSNCAQRKGNRVLSKAIRFAHSLKEGLCAYLTITTNDQ